MITPDDLRTAVRSGLISASQAAGLTALADQRLQARQGLQPSEEPFMLFRGFNEIFIVIGLSILFSGWSAFLWVLLFELPVNQDVMTPLGALATLAGLYVVQRYFTLTRRMVAPSIALAVMTGLTLLTLGSSLAELAGLPGGQHSTLAFATAALGLALHYRMFRVPFDALLIGAAGFSAVWSWLAQARIVPSDPFAILHFSSEGLPGLVSLGFGALCFVLAMWFDQSDPRRLSTRAATGFWLHVLAAPALINPIAMRLLSQGEGGQIALLAVLGFFALVALVIDRRSLLVSGAVYAVAIVFTLFDSPALILLGLGFGLVMLGAQWDRLRGLLLRSLPAFPGKDRLPPYGQMS